MTRSSLVYRIAGTAIILGLLYNYYTEYDYVHVDVDKGVLRGVNTTTWRGTSYLSFKGIPYARPPVGDLRFKEPVEVEDWTGVKDAIHHGSRCPQIDLALRIYRGHEDCLYLNVYTPSLVNGKLPVMVWIHGGGLVLGSGDDDLYGPDYLLNEGVILVTFNYRLGVLGFVATGDESAPGNIGLKDQVAALRWIRRNIAKFGGDPDNVTIFGESAGGASVNLHVLSPMSKGLFARAIAQSGSALDSWVRLPNNLDVAKRFVKSLGGPDVSDGAEVIRYLRTVPSEDLVKAEMKFRFTEKDDRVPIALARFMPSVEKTVDSKEAFLPSSPVSIIKSGNYNKVPLIVGYNSEEMLALVHDLLRPESMRAATENPELFVPNELTFEDDAAKTKFAESMRSLYYGDRNVTEDNIMDFVNFYTDFCFSSGIHRATTLHLATSDQPIFKYRFSHDGRLGLLRWLFWVTLPGAAHGDEFSYLFYHRMLLWWRPTPGSTDELMIRTMVRLWTNFAKQGHPTPEGDPVTWVPLSKDEFKYLMIRGDELVMGENPEAERMAFWQNAHGMNTA